MAHSVKVAHEPANLPDYRWLVSCSCGWQGRFAQEVNAESAGAAHSGVSLPKKPTIAAPAPKPVVEPVKPPAPATPTKT